MTVVTGDKDPHVEMEEAAGRAVHEGEVVGEGEAAARTTEDGTPKVS